MSRTGGDAWSLGGSDGATAATSAASAAVQTCNKWDAKGRNPALNVYVDIDAYRGSSSPRPSSGGGGGSSSSEAEDDEGPFRCKLGHLIQHCLPQLAARLGGYHQLALCWCTWLADEKSGQPVPSSIAAVGVQDPAHWRLLRQLVHTGMLLLVRQAFLILLEGTHSRRRVRLPDYHLIPHLSVSLPNRPRRRRLVRVYAAAVHRHRTRRLRSGVPRCACGITVPCRISLACKCMH